MHAVLVLEDGTIVEGEGFGAEAEVFGEAVFNTSMSGYQEALTDPSYKGQILMLTYPLVGNYGVNDSDFESDRIQVEGFVVRESCRKPSHPQASKTLDRFLGDQGIPGISGVDTRSLTIKMRAQGTMKAMLKTSSEEIDTEGLVERVRESCREPSHPQASKTLDRFLGDQGIPGISGVDTRSLTIKMRAQGTMKAMLKTSSEEIDTEGLVER
ncbi:MAG: hypothetical protein D6733_06480, partial [Methanobacteriota archaeon]